MKKIISIILAIITVISMTVPAFAAFGDYSNKTYKFCPDSECRKINGFEATECRKCGGALDEEHIIPNVDGDMPEGKGGHFLRCPECSWVNSSAEPQVSGECRYCDADITVCLDDVNTHFFYVRFITYCPGCSTSIVSDDADFNNHTCVFCDYTISENDDIVVTRYTNDPLDPDANWDEIPDGSATDEEESLFQKIINAIINFFMSIASFFENVFSTTDSLL